MPCNSYGFGNNGWRCGDSVIDDIDDFESEGNWTVGKWRSCWFESGVKFGEDMIRTLLSTRAYMVLRLGLLHVLKVSPVSRVALCPATRPLSPLPRYSKRGYQPQAHRLSTMSSSTMTNSPMIGIIGMGDVSSKFAEW